MARNSDAMDWWMCGKKEYITVCFPRQTVFLSVYSGSNLHHIIIVWTIYCNLSQQTNVYTVALP